MTCFHERTVPGFSSSVLSYASSTQGDRTAYSIVYTDDEEYVTTHDMHF